MYYCKFCAKVCASREQSQACLNSAEAKPNFMKCAALNKIAMLRFNIRFGASPKHQLEKTINKLW